MAAHIASGNIVLKRGEATRVHVGNYEVRISEEDTARASDLQVYGFYFHIPVQFVSTTPPVQPTISQVVSGLQDNSGNFQLRAVITSVGDLAAVAYSLFRVD